MTNFELTTESVQAHTQALTDITGTVENAARSGAARVGTGDFGVMFLPLMAVVNGALSLVGGAVTRHGAELTAHRRDFERTVAVLRDADDVGAEGTPR